MSFNLVVGLRCICMCMLVGTCVLHDMMRFRSACVKTLRPSPSSSSPPARVCGVVCEVSVAGWLLVVVVGWFSGRTNPPRYPLTLNLNGLCLRCCLTVPLSTVELHSDSIELLVVFRTRLQVISRKSLRLNNTMADQGSPVISAAGGFTPINRSPGNNSM